jgi:hypothetical protein
MNRIVTLALAVVLSGLLPNLAEAQEPALITGRVTSQAGAGLGSAVIQLPALNIGAVSRADGSYTVLIPAARYQPGQRVEVRVQLLGYQSQSETLTLASGPNTWNPVLAIDVLRVDEIVVTGAGLVTRAERLGTARTTVSEELIQRSSEPNLISALAAKAPGVVTSQAGGEPGAGTSIRIRGTSTLL